VVAILPFACVALARPLERDENVARDKLEQEWSQFSPAQRTECVRLVTLGGGPSYVELLTCLELAKQVKELPAAGPNGNGGEPIEKLRHIK
jgi:hypothetical protein